MIQSLVSCLRKVRDYEDATMPPWAEAWMAAHPGDREEAGRIIGLEPRPPRKVPKGLESVEARLR